MLSPKKVKFRKQQKGRIKGMAVKGSSVVFGDIALKALEPGKLSNQQIESARIAMMRHIKRGGKVWIRIFPDKPVTAKPGNTRVCVRSCAEGPDSLRDQRRESGACDGSLAPGCLQVADQDRHCAQGGLGQA